MGGNRLGSDPEVEKLARTARKNGFDVYQKSNSHLVWVAPLKPGETEPAVLVSPLTFKDTRRVKKIAKFLRENGCEGLPGVRARKKTA